MLATPHSLHSAQTIAAARAGKHVFCEKPFALTKADAEAAVAATEQAGVTLGLGYNRRFHPEMTKLRERISPATSGRPAFRSDDDVPECAAAEAGAWRAHRDETPCGGLTPMGVHAIDGMIDLGGEIDQVYCQSFHRVVPVDSDDTTSMLFRMKRRLRAIWDDHGDRAGLQLPGVRVEGLGALGRDDARGGGLLGGAPHAAVWHLQVSADQGPGGGVGSRAPRCHARVPRGLRRRLGGAPYLIPTREMIHGAAVTEAVSSRAASGKVVAGSVCLGSDLLRKGLLDTPPVFDAGPSDRRLGSALEERQHLSARGEGARGAGRQIRRLSAHVGALGRARLAPIGEARRRSSSSSPTRTSISTPPMPSSTVSSSR